MKKCTCSERPLSILSSKAVIIDNVPYQEYIYACSNKKCEHYREPMVKRLINLFDRKTIIEEEI